MELLHQFTDELRQLSLPPRVLIAVSGGRDSMALALLCAHAKKQADIKTDFIAVTIDHGLREESAAEARRVGGWCTKLGLAHRTIQWNHEGSVPESAVQERARAARYALLCQCADTLDAGAILIGHTLDDQAETVWMRLTRGSGPAGLAAMRRERLVAGRATGRIRLMRPLLPVRRLALTDYLQKNNQLFIDDPANQNADFERVRTRGLLQALAARSIVSPSPLAATATRCAVHMDQQAHMLPALAQGIGLTVHGWGGVSFCAVRWARETASRRADLAVLAGRILSAVGHPGANLDPPRAMEAVDAARESGRATLGGCLIEYATDRGSTPMTVYREPAGFFGRETPRNHVSVLPTDGRMVLWDERFSLRLNGPAPSPGGEWAIKPPANPPSQGLIPAMAAITLPHLFGPDLPALGVLLTPGTFDFGANRLSVRCLIEEEIFNPVHRFVMPATTAADIADKSSKP
ncbi:MAG: tRNA lysidine(34) synthetase TilS [Pseudomonadota bacterium]